MLKSEQQKYREEVATIFIKEYLPQIQIIVAKHLASSEKKLDMSVDISNIIGSSVGVQLDELRIAKPTNELIDKLVKIHVREIERAEK